MKKYFVIVSAVLLANQAFTGEPFDRVDTNQVVRVVVGFTEPFGDDAFADNPRLPALPKLQQYFEVCDAQLAKKLAFLVKDMKKTDEMTYPPIGILSEQKFMDSASNVVFTTHIVNYEATVVVDSLTGAGKEYFRTGHSFEFCRVVYEMMKKYCPHVIEKQDKFYREVDKPLEELLFGKKEKKKHNKAIDSD